MEARWEGHLIAAWQTERIRLQTRKNKRLPDLRKLLEKTRTKQGPRQMRASLQQLAQEYGLPMRPVKKRKQRTDGQ